MTRASLCHTMNHKDLLDLFRSSHQRCSVKKGVLKTFANFTGKHLRQSLFLITLLVFRPLTLLKRYRSSHQRCYIKRAAFYNFCNIHRKTPAQESLSVKVIGLQACNFLKKRLRHGCFSVNIVKFLRTPTLKNTCKRLLLFVSPQNSIALLTLDQTRSRQIAFYSIKCSYIIYM